MSYQYPDVCIVVMCKAPITGEVKTRLMPGLDARAACDAHIELTHRLLMGLATAHIAPVALWCSPDMSHPFFGECAEQLSVSLHCQVEGDLGIKMYQAIQASLQQAELVVLLGCDCPSLQFEDICFAIECLRSGEDVVLGPTEDGGYALIACQESHWQLFEDIPWSTERVLDATLDKALSNGINVVQTRRQWDVDTFSDWQRFCALESRKMMT